MLIGIDFVETLEKFMNDPDTDAVVVIVSEETGTISVAISGMLKRHLAPQTLEKLLLNELAPQREEKTRNPLKLLRRKQKENKDAKK